MENKNVPEIRFPGFTEDWVSCKLGEVFEQTSEYVNPKLEDLELWSLTVENGLTPKTDRYNREFLVKKEDQFKAVPHNEFIYNPMNMTLGAVDLNSTGKKVAVSGYYITMRTKGENDSEYFGVWLKTPSAIRMYKIFATGSLIERQRVQFPTLSQIKTLVPIKEEQVLIGEFFKSLDDTIALLQSELTTLKQTKQGFLQKMFPKEGESVPVIRFPGFSGEWNEFVLGDLGKTFTGLTGKTKEDFGKGAAEFVTYMNVFSNPISDTTMTENVEIDPKQNELMCGDILFTTSSETPHEVGMSSVWLNDRSNVYLNSFCFGYRPTADINSLFMAYLLRSESVRNQMILLAQGISRYNISKTKVMQIAIKLPGKEEQQMIGNFFNQLDQTIALQEKELEALQQTKKAFLQKMFV